jgi:hypothetical protein
MKIKLKMINVDPNVHYLCKINAEKRGMLLKSYIKKLAQDDARKIREEKSF